MGWLVAIGLGLWFWFGDPGRTVANWVYSDTAAPWEQVDAFYYPDRSDMTVHEEFIDVGSVPACRSMVHNAARLRSDPTMTRGDYECGVSPRQDGSFGFMTVYRITVR